MKVKTTMSSAHVEASHKKTAYMLEIPAPISKQPKFHTAPLRFPRSIPGISSPLIMREYFNLELQFCVRQKAAVYITFSLNLIISGWHFSDINQMYLG